MEENTRKLSSVLAEAMQAKNMSVEKLATLSNVSERFLEPLLTDRYTKLPASPYLRGYIFKIASILNLDGEKIWETYFRESDLVRRSGGGDSLPKNRFEKIRIDRKYIVGALLALLALIYVVWRIQAYFSPPPLSLPELSDNMIVAESSFTIKGNIDPKHQLSLNGEQIYPDESGNFEKTIELQPGFNALSFKIKKFLGNEYTIEKQIFWKTVTSSKTVSPALENEPEASENKNTLPTSTGN
jgi:cytoskeletal protein RodZ